MTWCRIIDAEGETYLCVASPSDEGLALVTTWLDGATLRSAVVPPQEFRGPVDTLEFLAAMRPENVLALRRGVEEAEAMAAAELAMSTIDKARGLH